MCLIMIVLCFAGCAFVMCFESWSIWDSIFRFLKNISYSKNLGFSLRCRKNSQTLFLCSWTVKRAFEIILTGLDIEMD